MTSPTSYLVYDKGYGPDYKEGVFLTRIVVSETQMIVRRVEVQATEKTGALFEKVRLFRKYLLCTNENNEQYVKFFTMDSDGKIVDSSLEDSFNPSFVIINAPMRDGGQKIINSTLMGWFGYTYDANYHWAVLSLWAEMLFPAIRAKPSSLDYLALKDTLKALQVTTGRVTKLFREGDSWDAFIVQLCHPTVKREQDMDLIRDNFESLIALGVMELGDSMSSLYAKNSSSLLTLGEFLVSHFDMKLIRFMFKYLSNSERAEALELLLQVADTSVSLPNGRSMSRGSIVIDTPFHRIPKEKRILLAHEILKWLTAFLNKYKDEPNWWTSAEPHMVPVDMTFMDNFKCWFAKEVIEPQLRSIATVESITHRFTELFELPVTTNFLESMAREQGRYLFFSMKRLSVVCDPHSDAVTAINYLVKGKERPLERGFIHPNLEGYTSAETGEFIPIHESIYSLDDFMTFLETSVKVIDKQLTKLGRETTPKNRAAYLMLRDNEERNYKDTWRYYDLGITRLEHILALKLGRVRSKKDIIMFSALPEEMLYELISLRAGREIRPSEVSNMIRYRY